MPSMNLKAAVGVLESPSEKGLVEASSFVHRAVESLGDAREPRSSRVQQRSWVATSPVEEEQLQQEK